MTEQLKRMLFRDREHAASLKPGTVVRLAGGGKRVLNESASLQDGYAVYHVDQYTHDVVAVWNDRLEPRGVDIAEIVSEPDALQEATNEADDPGCLETVKKIRDLAFTPSVLQFDGEAHACSLKPGTVVRTMSGTLHTIAKLAGYEDHSDGYATYDTTTKAAVFANVYGYSDNCSDIAEIVSAPGALKEPHSASYSAPLQNVQNIPKDPLSCTGEPLPMVDADGSKEMGATIPAEVDGRPTDRVIWTSSGGPWHAEAGESWDALPHLRPPKPGAPPRFDRPKPQPQLAARQVWYDSKTAAFAIIARIEGSLVEVFWLDCGRVSSFTVDQIRNDFTYMGQRLEVRDGRVVVEEGGE